MKADADIQYIVYSNSYFTLIQENAYERLSANLDL